MKIQDVLNKNVMLFDLQATDKEGVINEMVQSLVDNGVVTDFDTFKAGIMNREAQTSTGLCDGIAKPNKMKQSKKQRSCLQNQTRVWITLHLMVNQQTCSS